MDDDQGERIDIQGGSEPERRGSPLRLEPQADLPCSPLLLLVGMALWFMLGMDYTLDLQNGVSGDDEAIHLAFDPTLCSS